MDPLLECSTLRPATRSPSALRQRRRCPGPGHCAPNRKYSGRRRPLMNLGILGSGDVGRSLGRGLAAKGHTVMIGSRTPGKPELAEWRKAAGAKASTGTFAQAAAHGELLVLATNGAATEAAIDLAGAKNFADKGVIDGA